ncbi:hypothetical protein F5050DRAFT_1900879 [Lentinula boryana]|uniref:Uncharacterized protein n=1 Tax=Lentinula boryana TaxID=40481 RepID=A0ABQ8QLB9_9AGAR|nr:hypothetical protein F5050DRAFT_1900879 [Lentinula boryana]
MSAYIPAFLIVKSITIRASISEVNVIDTKSISEAGSSTRKSGSITVTGTLTDEEIEELVSSDEEEEELENDIANLGRYLNDASDYFQRASLKLTFFDDEEVSLRNNPSLYMQIMYLPAPFQYWLFFFWEQFMPKRTEGDSWVVRNYTKGEFVVKSRDWLVDGAWAGDSIDITLASIHELEYGNETDWKDITAEVKQKLEALAEAESRPFEF